MTTRQERYVFARVAGRGVLAASAAAGVSRRTGCRWESDPAIAAEIERRRAEAFRESLNALRRLNTKAVKTADALLSSTKPEIRLGATRAVLGSALKVAEVVDLAERMAAVEKRIRPEGSE